MKHEPYKVTVALASNEPQYFKVLIQFLLFSSLLLMLASCGNNAEVEGNANTADDEVARYQGPAPLTTDVQTFKREFWDVLSAENRCGRCHTSDGEAANYAFVDLEDVNNAFSQAMSTNDNGELLIDLENPASSRVVLRVAEGHNCWESNPDVCSTIIERYINNWAGGVVTDSTGRDIVLSAPEEKEVGDSKNFPATAQGNDPVSFEKTVYSLLSTNCSECHTKIAKNPQSPFFASADVDAAYEAAKSKINLDIPENSQFVARLQEKHNCWTASCQDDANEMQAEIESFAGAISLTQVDPSLVISKAMSLGDSILASGGSRFEDKQIALWEFKTGVGSKALDTSGIEPAMNLTFSGPVTWVLGYGIDISTGGKAQASTESSAKLEEQITLTGEYSIEAWVIPGNVSQEDARIISYSAGDTARNFSLSQTLYNYEFLNRSSKLISTNIAAGAAGRESLMTNDEDEDLQASLQHVVVTFDPVNGRRVYVNGVFTGDEDADAIKGGSLNDWNDTYAFVLGNEVSGEGHAWSGKIRMVAIHKAALSDEQITQNYEVGVGQKYLMLFSVADVVAEPDTYIMFEVEQFDNTAYLFNQPRFISLNADFVPSTDIAIKGMRIGVNGREAVSGQVFGNLDMSVNTAEYTANGQIMSTLGTVIAVQKGPESDEFFLTFELLGAEQNARIEADPVIPVFAADPALSPDIGVKTFDEINASMSVVTGVPVAQEDVAATFESYKQQLPAVENISAFLASHQMGVAQMAMSYCNVLVNTNKAFFTGFDFNKVASVAFDAVSKQQIIEPLLVGLMNLDTSDPTKNLLVQPDEQEINDLLGATSPNVLTSSSGASLDNTATSTVNEGEYDSLITTMTACLPNCDTDNISDDTTVRTEEIVKAVCAATLGSALMLIQ